jgi:hypothetical protein
MSEQELSCALRALTLCDGTAVAEPWPRSTVTRCYCAELADVGPSVPLEVSQKLRTDRARVVAQSARIQASRDWRQVRGNVPAASLDGSTPSPDSW